MTKNILVIEDFPNWKDTLGRLLTNKGYEVQFSTNYSDALEKILRTGGWFAGYAIDICIVDLRLENEFNVINYDGLGILAVCKLRDITTIVVSGYLNSSIIGQVQNEFGAKGIFDKTDFDNNIQDFLSLIEKELVLVSKKSLRDNYADGKIDSIKYKSTKNSMIKDALESYEKAHKRINDRQTKRSEVLGRVDPDDEAKWRRNIEELDERLEALMSKISKAKNKKELDDLHHLLSEESIAWMTIK